MKSFVSFALIGSVLVSTAAFAQEAEKKDKKDPNRMICKTEPVLGSRLAQNKTCMTAQQWEEQRRLSRMEVDRSQALNYKNN